MLTTISKLTENEILFCARWVEVIKHKDRILSTDLDYCYKLIYNTGLQNQCPDCLRNYAKTLHGYYKTIAPAYQTYLQELAAKEAEIVYTQNQEQIEKEIVEEKIEVKPVTASKPNVTKSGTKKNE